MNPNSKNKADEIILDLSPAIRLYKSGYVERLPILDPPPVSPGFHPQTGVNSKDIKISINTNLKIRIYNPKNPQILNNQPKLPLILYFHGGGFLLESTFSAKYHNYLNRLASEARSIIVSVEYRRAPEHRLPAAYNDCWDALNWAITTNEPWIRDFVDYSRIFLMGDSAGGNIAHQTAIRIGIHKMRYEIDGIILVHPYFWGKDRIGDEKNKRNYFSIRDLPYKVWQFARPGIEIGVDHKWINPENEPNLGRLGCKRVLICVAEEDVFRDRGLYYKKVLEESGWEGDVEVFESKGEDHVYYLMEPSSSNSLELMARVVAFINPSLSKL
ncbi:probable carboxylesterase 2 [Amaranthus tricolor]|uniref:probable carboxylesterase 2 n=1 Tax=Amaranthus tricolor TaxID=29722 RepID=UPI00258FE410|nr:probable carboxylesterase 2 [Amaranthus tricolor]